MNESSRPVHWTTRSPSSFIYPFFIFVKNRQLTGSDGARFLGGRLNPLSRTQLECEIMKEMSGLTSMKNGKINVPDDVKISEYHYQQGKYRQTDLGRNYVKLAQFHTY